MAGEPTVPELNTKLNKVVTDWQKFIDENRGWVNGPNETNDSTGKKGKRPLSDASGRVLNVDTPAQLEYRANKTTTDFATYVDANFLDRIKAGALPPPDFDLPLTKDLYIRTGKGTSAAEGLPLYKADFTRASTATYVDKDGVLKVAGVNEPRFEKEGILIEGASTNLLANSENMKHWIKTSTGSPTITHDQPDVMGRNNASKFTCDGEANNFFGYGVGDMFAQDGEYTFSVFVKSASGKDTPFGLRVGNVDSAATNIATNTWKRFSITGDCKAGYGQVNVWISRLDTTEGLVICYPQLEELPFASSYIPTNGTAVTRAGDNLRTHYVPSPELGTISVEASLFGVKSYATYPPIYSFGFIRFENNLEGSLYYHMSRGGENYNSVGYSSESCRDQITYTASYKYRLGVDYFKNGNCTNSIKSGEWDLATRDSTCFELFGHIKNFKIWNKALTDQQVKSIGKLNTKF